MCNVHNHPKIKESIVFFIISLTHIFTRKLTEWAVRRVKYPVERLDECLMLKISFIFIATHSKFPSKSQGAEKISKKLFSGAQSMSQIIHFGFNLADSFSALLSFAMTWIKGKFFIWETFAFCWERGKLEKIYFAPQASY